MERKILMLAAQNLFLKMRIWFICKFFKNLLNTNRSSDVKPGWELTFVDDFDEFRPEIWQDYPYYGHRFHPGNIVDKGIAPHQYFESDCISVESSVLRLKAEHNPIEIHYVKWDGTDYGKYTILNRVGYIQTMPKTFQQRLGYFEIRSKSPNSPGCWPSFWLCSTEAWPPEIDIFEIFTSDGQKTSTSTIHWGKDPNHPMSGFRHATLELNNSFQVWGCEWNEEQIKIYYNGWLVRVFPTPDDFTYELNVIINNAVQEHNNKPREITSPNYFEVDYVKVWKKI